MKAGIIKRLEEIEARYKQDPIIVLARLDSGEEVKMTMRELLETPGAQFKKVIAGSSLEDMDLFLKEVERQAHEEGKVTRI